jgi:HTH-type transcriptional regulator/antitoxin HigA
LCIEITTGIRHTGHDHGGPDRFAADALIPPRHATELSSLKSLAAITELAGHIGVAPGIVVGRLQHEGIIGFNVGHQLFERYRLAEKG